MSVHRAAPTASGRRAWVVRWRDRDTGRQRQRTFHRRADARDFDAELIRRRAWGPAAVTQLAGGGTTLEQWREDRWRPEHAAGRLEAATESVYDAVFDRHIAPTLGSTPLSEITPSALRAWQGRLVAAGCGTPAIRKARTTLGSVLTHAASCEAIAANPLAVVPAPRGGRPRAVRPVMLDKVEAIRAWLIVTAQSDAAGMSDAALISVLSLAGLRPGEARALRWGDVGQSVLTIERAIGADGAVKSTKTRTIGTVKMLAPVVQDLTALRAARRYCSDNATVFHGLDDVAGWARWREQRWAPACAAVGLRPRPRPYDLRHTFASALLAEGRQVHDVARQMRHSPELTLGTYGHLLDDVDASTRFDTEGHVARLRLDAEVDRATAPTPPANQ